MTIPDKVADEAIAIAKDDSHGYDQRNRWGNPDYDCSALPIDLYKKAGVPLTSTYTGNMKADMLSHHFRDVTKMVNLTTGAGLQRGDVLLNETHHAAIYVGNGQIVHATGNEFGGVLGGQPGDQTGREICIAPYYNFPWDCVLRYEGPQNAADGDNKPTNDTYVIKAGDTLWDIATAHNMTVDELCRINNLDPAKYIYPGQVLKLKPTTEHTTANPSHNSDPDDTYTVKAGDSLWQIAQNQLGNGWKWYRIADVNNLKYPYIIHPGDQLKIPK